MFENYVDWYGLQPLSPKNNIISLLKTSYTLSEEPIYLSPKYFHTPS